MESKFKTDKWIKNGYNFRTTRSRINLNAKDPKKDAPKTANGWIFFGVLLAVWVIIFVIASFKHGSYLSYSEAEKNAFAISSGILFGINLLWISGRTLIFSHVTYTFYKLSEFMKLRKLKRFLKLSQDDALFDNMSSYDEYKDYLELKKQNTTLSFAISIGFFTILFIISLIVAFV